MTENVRGRSSETKFGRVPLWLYDTGVGLQAIATYGWLHGRYGHYERVMPSYGTLAKELGVSRGSVIAYVKALTSVGAVRIQTSGAAGRQTNVYVIAFAAPFRVGGQNTDQGGQDADPVVSGVHHPGQPAGRGGQPVVQEEDVSSKTFLEDEKLSLPDAAPQRAEVATVSDEREIPVSTDQPSTAQRVVRAAGIVTADEEEAFITWTTAKHQPRSSAWWRTVASNGDLPDLAADWRAQGGLDAAAPLTGTDATVAGWLNLAGQLGGRQSHQPYRDDPWHHIKQQAAAGDRPDGWERVPFCGHLDCDEITRMRQVDTGDGLKSLTYCSGCHPALQF